MTTKYFADATTGKSLGGFGADRNGNVTPPPNSVETPPPEHGEMIWTGSAWEWPVEALHSRMVAAVKAEANRRILAVMPEWKQRNSLAAGLEATMTYGPDPSGWPQEVQAKHSEAMAAWATISAIRAASDALEEMDPIPTDYAADHHWPESEAK